MRPLYASAFAVSDIGRCRDKNEDSFCLAGEVASLQKRISLHASPAARLLCCVCDGMGGIRAGELASNIAAQTVCERAGSLLNAGMVREQVIETVRVANGRVYREAVSSSKEMGSTIALFGFCRGTATLASVGDSRIYLLRDGNFSRLTTDHTRAQLLVRAGVMSESEAAGSRAAHELTQYLGMDASQMMIEPDFLQLPAYASDTFLLCSDGLYDAVSEVAIHRILADYAGEQAAARTLVEAALLGGGRDNITVIVVKIV